MRAKPGDANARHGDLASRFLEAHGDAHNSESGGGMSHLFVSIAFRGFLDRRLDLDHNLVGREWSGEGIEEKIFGGDDALTMSGNFPTF